MAKTTSRPEGRKHHYIPVFYLKAWCSPDDHRLCEYSQPHNHVIAKRRYPSETGFERGLYTLKRNAPEIAEVIEDRLMRATDNYAARAHQILRGGEVPAVNSPARAGWARFILSLFRRTPESIKMLGDKLDALRIEQYSDLAVPGDLIKDNAASQSQLATSEVQRALLLENVMNSPRIGDHLMNMRWGMLTFPHARHMMLTSDRPFVMTNGMSFSHSHLVMPISPHQCFVATNTAHTEQLLKEIPTRKFVDQINDKMACQARKFTYGFDDSQLRFVSKRFGRMEAAMPGEL